jgi:hypothetical protein
MSKPLKCRRCGREFTFVTGYSKSHEICGVCLAREQDAAARPDAEPKEGE